MNSNKTIILSSLVAFTAFAHVENTNIESVFFDPDERHSHSESFWQQFAERSVPPGSSMLHSIACAEETVLTPFLYDGGNANQSMCDVIIESDIKYFADLDRALLEAGKLMINWDNDLGLPPAQNAIHDARRFLTFLKLPTQICPVPDGSINISKIFGDNLLDVEIDGSGIASVFFGADPHNPLLMEVMKINDSNVAQIQLLISKT